MSKGGITDIITEAQNYKTYLIKRNKDYKIALTLISEPPFAFYTNMDPELKSFTDNVDAWIKQIRREFTNFSDIPSVVSENTDNIQHNYELIYELKDQIEELKQEINSLKLIQIISLKKVKEEQKTIS